MDHAGSFNDGVNALGRTMTPTTIVLHAEQDWDDVLIHEWFHYFDNRLAQVATQASGVLESDAMLSNYVGGTGEAAACLDQPVHPVAVHLKTLYTRLREAQHSVRLPDHHWQAWPAQMASVLEPDEAETWRAMAARPMDAIGHRTEAWEGLDEVSQLIPLMVSYTTDIPVWWDRWDRAAKYCRSHQLNASADWWGACAEQLAVAFECRLPERLGQFRDTLPLAADPQELAAMEPAWVAFFQAMAPMWPMIIGPPSPRT